MVAFEWEPIVVNIGREWQGLPGDLVGGSCPTAIALDDVHYSTVKSVVYRAAGIEVFRLDMAESEEQRDVDVPQRVF